MNLNLGWTGDLQGYQEPGKQQVLVLDICWRYLMLVWIMTSNALSSKALPRGGK